MKIYTLKTIILFVAIWIYFPMLYAQRGDTLFIQRGKKGEIEFARFKKDENSDRKMKNDTVFLKSILRARKDDGFRLKSKTTDGQGMIHKKFQQYYKGIPVDNAEYLVHGTSEDIEEINGDFQDINISNIKPAIDEQQAMTKALKYAGAQKYKWEDSDMENFIKQQKNNPNASYYPKGELVIAKDNLNGNDAFHLSWKFTISSLQPDNEQQIFVDAMNGEIIRDIPLIMDDNTSGSAQTMYSGVQNITCDSYTGGYRLYESRPLPRGGAVTIQTKNCSNGSNTGSAPEFTNTSANWSSGSWSTFNQNQAALDAHWAEEKVLDYWSSVHLRYSLNNTGLNILGYVHYNPGGYQNGWSNAQWEPTSKTMRYGDGDGISWNPVTSLDIIAHEMGHGICQFTANLTGGVTESAALNEGLSDIWAACIKYWATPNDSIWLIGNRIIRNPFYNCIRNLQYPKSLLAAEGQHPDTYKVSPWDAGGEPHCNSTVLSHWFYLLCQGGSGTNGIGNAYNITGIGIDKAQRIVYNAESSYLNSSADYNAARNAMIFAAINLYKDNSPEVISVTNAWYAVGVGNMYPPTISGSTILCRNSTDTYTILNAPVGATIVWNQSSNLQQVSSSGNSMVFKAIANGAGWISATVNGVSIPNYSIWCGIPDKNNMKIGIAFSNDYTITNLCRNVGITFGVLSHNQSNDHITGYVWDFGSWTPYVTSYFSDSPSGPTNAFANIILDANAASTQIVGVTPINACSSFDDYLSPPIAKQYFAIQCWGVSSNISVSPNPASTHLTIEIAQKAIAETPSKQTINDAILLKTEPTYDIRLYNSHGHLLRHATSKGGSVQFDVSHLHNGTYYLHVYDGISNKPEIQQIVVKH